MDVKETREILGGEQVQHRQDRGEVIILSITAFSHKDTHSHTHTHTPVTDSANTNLSLVWQHFHLTLSSYPALQPQGALD